MTPTDTESSDGDRVVAAGSDDAADTPTAPPPAAWVARGAVLVPLVIGMAGAVGAVGLGLGSAADPGPGAWPLIASLVVVGCAARLMLGTGHDGIEPVPPGAAPRVAAAALALAAFVPLFAAIGMPAPGFLLVLAWLRLFGESWRTSVLVAALGVVALHVLFVIVLGVPLPVGPLAPGA